MLRFLGTLVFLTMTMSAAQAIDVKEMRAAIGEKPPRSCRPDMSYAGRWDEKDCPQECGDPGLQPYSCNRGDPHWRGPEQTCAKAAAEYNAVREPYNKLVDDCSKRSRTENKFQPTPAPSSADDLSALLARQKQITSEVNKKHDGENENKQIIEEEDRDRAKDAPRVASETAKCINEEYSCSQGCGVPIPPRGASPSVRIDINKLCVEYCQSGAAYCKGLIIAATGDGMEYLDKLLDRLNDTERKINDLYKVLNEGIRQNNERIRRHNEQVAAEEAAEANRQYFNEMMGNVMQSFIGGGSSYQVYQNSRVNRTYTAPPPVSLPAQVPRSGSGGSTCKYQPAGNC